MPGVASQALNTTHVIAGCDFHNQLPPPPPLPAPHVVTWCIGMAGPGTSKEALTVKAGPGGALGRQHDCGMGPYHFAANSLLPLVWAGAGNKAQFAASSVRLQTGNMAVATIPIAGLNMQLDCNDPIALPTSMCVASLNTVFAGFTPGDAIGGFAAMLSDIALTFIVGKVAGLITQGSAKVLASALGAVAGPVPLMVVGVAMTAFPTAAAYVSGTSNMVVGWLIGTPLGYSVQDAPGSAYGAKLNDSVNDYFAKPTSPSTQDADTSAAPDQSHDHDNDHDDLE
jgi:hypothetical protein